MNSYFRSVLHRLQRHLSIFSKRCVLFAFIRLYFDTRSLFTLFIFLAFVPFRLHSSLFEHKKITHISAFPPIFRFDWLFLHNNSDIIIHTAYFLLFLFIHQIVLLSQLIFSLNFLCHKMLLNLRKHTHTLLVSDFEMSSALHNLFFVVISFFVVASFFSFSTFLRCPS